MATLPVRACVRGDDSSSPQAGDCGQTKLLFCSSLLSPTYVQNIRTVCKKGEREGVRAREGGSAKFCLGFSGNSDCPKLLLLQPPGRLSDRLFFGLCAPANSGRPAQSFI